MLEPTGLARPHPYPANPIPSHNGTRQLGSMSKSGEKRSPSLDQRTAACASARTCSDTSAHYAYGLASASARLAFRGDGFIADEPGLNRSGAKGSY